MTKEGRLWKQGFPFIYEERMGSGVSKKTKHNPERKSWKGKWYKKGGKRIRDEREKMGEATEIPTERRRCHRRRNPRHARSCSRRYALRVWILEQTMKRLAVLSILWIVALFATETPACPQWDIQQICCPSACAVLRSTQPFKADDVLQGCMRGLGCREQDVLNAHTTMTCYCR